MAPSNVSYPTGKELLPHVPGEFGDVLAALLVDPVRGESDGVRRRSRNHQAQPAEFPDEVLGSLERFDRMAFFGEAVGDEAEEPGQLRTDVTPP
ncbi:hypothetical protein STANM309S_03887 [Streptomyces tanashiensis]